LGTRLGFSYARTIGVEAEVVKAFRKLDHRIVATSRSIKLSDDENILSIAVTSATPQPLNVSFPKASHDLAGSIRW
jgi:hypothetical protein